MLILALESTTEACSVALLNHGSIVELFEFAPRKHTNLLLNMVDRLLKQENLSKNELSAIAFCRGPGAFTGLRITTGIAQGLAFGLNIPLIPVSSLAALAQGAHRTFKEQQYFLSCLDARKNELFWALYEINNGRAQCCGEEQVSSAGEITKKLQIKQEDSLKYQVVGTGTEIIKKLNEPRLSFVDLTPETFHYPQAYDIALLAEDLYKSGSMVTAEQAVPVYLRNNVTY